MICMPSAPALYERMLTGKAQITSTAWLTNTSTPFLQQDVEDMTPTRSPMRNNRLGDCIETTSGRSNSPLECSNEQRHTPLYYYYTNDEAFAIRWGARSPAAVLGSVLAVATRAAADHVPV